MRLVVDTNIWVSHLIRPTPQFGRLFQYIDGQATLLYSEELLLELIEVLHRQKFSQFTDPDQILGFIQWYVRKGTVVTNCEPISASADPKDNMFLEVALTGLADCIIAGDRHLTSLSPFRNIPILSPAEFIRQHIATP